MDNSYRNLHLIGVFRLPFIVIPNEELPFFVRMFSQRLKRQTMDPIQAVSSATPCQCTQ